jgi:hypothetical protein
MNLGGDFSDIILIIKLSPLWDVKSPGTTPVGVFYFSFPISNLVISDTLAMLFFFCGQNMARVAERLNMSSEMARTRVSSGTNWWIVFKYLLLRIFV